MNSEKRFPINLDSIAGLVTGFFLLLIALAVWLGSQIGVRVTAQLPADQAIGPFEALTLVFSEPVDESLAIENFSVQPEVKGKFEWTNSRTLRFVPLQPFAPDTKYTLTLTPGLLKRTPVPGPLSSSGRYLKKEHTWNFEVRPPLVVYLVVDSETSRLWTLEPDNGKTTPLTDETLKVFDFDTSRDGEFVVFSAFNEQNGIDLWRIARAGGAPVLLIQCGRDRCSLPAISPDGSRLAYMREAAGPTPDIPFGSPRVWMLEIETKQDAQLYEDGQIIGYKPVWSPDGTRLASFDGIADEFRMLDLVTSETLIIPSQTGSPVTWSSDGSIFLFTDIVASETGSHTLIRQARLATSEIITLFGENDDRDYYYNLLAWSPAKNALMIGLRPEENNPSEALWLMDPVTRDGQVAVDQSDYVYNNPYWDPWGRAMIFQQFRLRGVYKPEIGLWMPGLEKPRVLAEGLMPHWLP